MRKLIVILLFISTTCFSQQGSWFWSQLRNTAVVPPPSRQNLLFQSTFETVNNWTALTLPVDIGTPWGNQQTCCGLNSLDQAPTARVGARAAMFTERKSDPQISGSLRAEITGPDMATFGGVFWYGFSVFLPANFTTTASSMLVYQWHSSDFNNAGAAAQLEIGDDQMWSMVVTSNGSPTNLAFTFNDLGPIDRGGWTDWVCRFLWSDTNAGQMQIFKNGTQVYNNNNVITSWPGSIYFKTGVYAFGWAAGQGGANPQPMTIYIDEVRVGNSAATYFDVAAGAY